MKKRVVDPAKMIDEIQISLAEMKLELQVYSTLFQSMGDSYIQAQDISGLQVVFGRFIATIDKTNQRLNEIY